MSVRYRHLFDHSKKSNPVFSKKENAAGRPAGRHRLSTIPQWPDTGVAGYRLHWFIPPLEIAKPIHQSLAWEFVGIKAKNPGITSLGPGKRPMRFLLKATSTFKIPSPETGDQFVNAF